MDSFFARIWLLGKVYFFGAVYLINLWFGEIKESPNRYRLGLFVCIVSWSAAETQVKSKTGKQLVRKPKSHSDTLFLSGAIVIKRF